VTLAALEVDEVDVDFGVDPDTLDEPLGEVDFAPLAGVVAVVAAAGVVPLLAAAVTGVADPFKQLVSPAPA